MKKSWVVVLGAVVLLGAGCGGVREKAMENAIERASGGQAKVDLDDGTMKVETKDGTAQWGGNKLPDDWPSDVPVYAGAQIQISGSSAAAGGKVSSAVVLQTADPGQTVLDFYKKELAAQGWKIGGTFQSGATASLAAGKDDRTVAITIASSGNQTMITIGIGKK